MKKLYYILKQLEILKLSILLLILFDFLLLLFFIFNFINFLLLQLSF